MTMWSQVQAAAEAAGIDTHKFMRDTENRLMSAIIDALGDIQGIPSYEANRLYHTKGEIHGQVEAILRHVMDTIFSDGPRPGFGQLSFDFGEGFKEGRDEG